MMKEDFYADHSSMNFFRPFFNEDYYQSYLFFVSDLAMLTACPMWPVSRPESPRTVQQARLSWTTSRAGRKPASNLECSAIAQVSLDLASAASSVSPLVTSSCFTPSSGFSPAGAAGLSSTDFRGFGLGASISAGRHHSLHSYPYLSQVNQTS